VPASPDQPPPATQASVSALPAPRPQDRIDAPAVAGWASGQRDGWGLGTGLAAVAIFFFVQLIVSLAMVIGGAVAMGLPDGPDAAVALQVALEDLPTWATLAAAVVGQVASLGVVAWFMRARGADRRMLGVTAIRGRFLAIGLGLGLVGLVATVLVTAALQSILDVEDPAQQSLVDVAGEGSLTTVLVLVAAVLVAPVLEELVFRAVLLPPLVARLGAPLGIVVNGVAFALIHLELVFAGRPGLAGLAALAVLGTMLAWSMHRWRSLVVPIATHAAFNGVTLAIVIGTG